MDNIVLTDAGAPAGQVTVTNTSTTPFQSLTVPATRKDIGEAADRLREGK